MKVYNGNTVIFTAKDKGFEYGENVEIVIKDHIMLENGSEIFGNDGMKANTLLPEISRSFQVVKEDFESGEDFESSEGQGDPASPSDNTSGFIAFMAILAFTSLMAIIRLKKAK